MLWSQGFPTTLHNGAIDDSYAEDDELSMVSPNFPEFRRVRWASTA
jgi:hypothetical protein